MNPVWRAANNTARWRDDPIAFVREEFKVEPDEWQKDFLLNYRDQKRSGAKACKGPGKTAVLSWCAWHFLATRPHPKIAATSISGDNLRDGLWTEMSKWQQKSDYLSAAFEWQKERIICREHPETWWMSARRWSQSANPELQANTLAGLHADYILFILDEAGGIPDAVMAAAEAALASGIECKLLICGNPTHLSGPLYRACTRDASMWKMIEISGDPENPKRSPRINLEWANEQIRQWGRENPWVMVNVFGQFPPSSINALLGPDDITTSMNRVVTVDSYTSAAKVLGVDVARQGDDSTVLQPRQGIVAFKPKILRIPDTQQIAAHVADAINKWHPDMVNIDATGGWGYGVIDALRSWGYAVNDVQFSGKPLKAQYFNKRAEIHFELASWVLAGGCLPNLPELREELTVQTYTHKKDKLMMTEKEQLKALLGRSPDLADALALTFAFPVVKKNPMEQFTVPQVVDYNPILLRDQPRTQSPLADYNPLP